MTCVISKENQIQFRFTHVSRFTIIGPDDQLVFFSQDHDVGDHINSL